ncbi:MAG: JAB domain-containing protein [Clostridia bacterium]|nr:JAB domain-containing protein [Clostridia bacterium]
MADELYSALVGVLSYVSAEPESAAQQIVSRFGNYPSLAAADYDELSRMPAVGDSGATLIRLLMAITSRRRTDKFKFGRVHTEEETVDYLKALFYTLENENVYVLLLDEGRRVTFCEFLGEGTVNASSIMPRRVLELAVKRDARYVILAHNHPMGVAKPSVEDIETTLTVKQLLASSSRELLAHYVIAPNEYFKIEP